MPDRIRLDGRVAVVTGAAGIIGTATMQLLAERGARIVAVDRRQADLQAAIKALPASAEALAVTADVIQEDEVADYVRAAVDKFGTIDVFYNNAGIEGEIKPITEYPLETFRKVLDVNVVGVNCVCPGLIDSRMLSAILDGRKTGNIPTPIDKIVDRIPARRPKGPRLPRSWPSLPPTKRVMSRALPTPWTAAEPPPEPALTEQSEVCPPCPLCSIPMPPPSTRRSRKPVGRPTRR
jgi:NAD(P)-dependent dehydrogenase (short-subunit alcohol dehydrogenase family)